MCRITTLWRCFILKKSDIVELIKSMDWSKDSYWITAGAGLVMHEVKENTRDIDIGCTSQMMEELIRSNTGRHYFKNGRAVEINDIIEIFENWNVDEIVYIDDLPVASLESIKKQKHELGREKDIHDIKEIDKYIKMRNNNC